MTTTLRITVDDTTYRDLFQFADLARVSHIDPSTKVDWVLPFGLEGELELDGDYRPPLTLDGEEARDLVEALDLVAESDGDVRQMMSVLAEWRDRLRDRFSGEAASCEEPACAVGPVPPRCRSTRRSRHSRRESERR